MTTTTPAPIPSFEDDEEAGGRKLCIICSKGSLDMAYPGPGAGQRRAGRGHRDPPVLHVLGLRHHQPCDDGPPAVLAGRQLRDAHADGVAIRSRRHRPRPGALPRGRRAAQRRMRWTRCGVAAAATAPGGRTDRTQGATGSISSGRVRRAVGRRSGRCASSAGGTRPRDRGGSRDAAARDVLDVQAQQMEAITRSHVRSCSSRLRSSSASSVTSCRIPCIRTLQPRSHASSTSSTSNATSCAPAAVVSLLEGSVRR